tara:strand:+ start:1363 stop:2364 length:1002 start_codon:yes stop_codon:yes gene_type:complete
MKSLFKYRDIDKDFWYEELEEWVPKRIYDCHVHLINNDIIDKKSIHKDIYPNEPLSKIREWHRNVFPNRDVNSLIIGKPLIGTDINAHNEFIYQEINGETKTRAHRLTTPKDSLKDIENDIKNKGFQGLKVYRYFSSTGDPNECSIEDYLPHEQLELANELGIWITLHMAKQDGCGDKRNLSDLEEFTTKRYPNIKWILAHVARSFTYRPIEKGIDTLKNLPNIWYDLSAVTDIRPFITLFKNEDHKRIFYGTDGIESVSFHGAYNAYGHAHQQLETDKVSSLTFLHTSNRPILCLYEQLISIKHASIICEINKDQLEDIFWKNAVTEFSVDW